MRQDWAAYLGWVRNTVGVPVRNNTEVVDIDSAPGGLLAAQFGDGSVRFARKVVLATGQNGAGMWWMPSFVSALPIQFRAHAADPIDFDTLRGRRVAVLGAGASAFDNAAMALEAGAAEVALFCRRTEPQVVQPYRWAMFAGFLQHISDLDPVSSISLFSTRFFVVAATGRADRLDGGHPYVQHRLNHEFWTVRFLHQRHDDRGAEAGLRGDARAVHGGC